MVLSHLRSPRVVSPAAVGDEILEHLPAIARKRRLDLGVLLPVLATLPLDWVDAERYAEREAEARQLMRGRDEDDWPVVALALAMAEGGSSVGVWTQDKDLDAAALETYTTGRLLDILGAGSDESEQM